MRQLITLFVLTFLLIWGLGLLFGFLGEFRKVKLPSPIHNSAQPAYLEDQQKIATDTEESRKKFMEDYRYQVQKYKDNQPEK